MWWTPLQHRLSSNKLVFGGVITILSNVPAELEAVIVLGEVKYSEQTAWNFFWGLEFSFIPNTAVEPRLNEKIPQIARFHNRVKEACYCMNIDQFKILLELLRNESVLVSISCWICISPLHHLSEHTTKKGVSGNNLVIHAYNTSLEFWRVSDL